MSMLPRMRSPQKTAAGFVLAAPRLLLEGSRVTAALIAPGEASEISLSLGVSGQVISYLE